MFGGRGDYREFVQGLSRGCGKVLEIYWGFCPSVHTERGGIHSMPQDDNVRLFLQYVCTVLPRAARGTSTAFS